MDKDRSLTPSVYSLGVEGDHKIDKIVLATPKKWEETDVSNADVALHMMTENGYFHNAVCEERLVDEECVRFLFPVTREMTCKSGKLKVEFSFSDTALPFSFTSRTAELLVADSLTDSEEIESDYSGLLWDVTGKVEGFSSRLEVTEKSVAELEKSVEEIDIIKGFFGYNDEEILGLEADFENNDFTRLAGAQGLEAGADFDSFAMYQRRRCNVSDDGTIVAYYGDENYRDDGSNGQVMVYQPAFYYRVVPTKLEKIDGGLGHHIRKANYYISAKPKPFFKLHPAFYDGNGKPVEYILYSAYEGSMYDVSAGEYVNDGTNTDTSIDAGDLLCSVAGVKPISGLKKRLTKANLELMAQNRNSGWHLETIKATSANQLLMMVELGTMNTQTAIGQGVVNIGDNSAYNCSSLTGSTADLGNGTGQAAKTISEIGGTETAYTIAGKVSVSYRGIENPWGNIYKHIQGINIWGDGTMGGGQPYVANTFTFNENKHNDGNYEPVGFTLANATGYIKAMGYGNEKFDWLLMPSEIGGTSQFPAGDYLSIAQNLNEHRIVRLGGHYNTAAIAGGFCFACDSTIGTSIRGLGGRLLYVPTAK